jgi:5-(carboxyamino)imidazole ribonucleotide synthase
MMITSDADLERAAAIFRGRRCVMERWVDFSCELSVVIARSKTGEVKAFPLAENIHTRQVLDFSIVPARVSPAIAREAVQLAAAMAEKLGVVGLLAAEMFVTPSGDVLVNELAPGPHNSGHWSLDGCETSQFEQHLRAVCDLPLGSVALRAPTVMVNILGDAWHARREGQGMGDVRREPNWSAILAAPRAKLHLYGIAEPRRGRKVGHFTVCDADIETAMMRARELKQQL